MSLLEWGLYFFEEELDLLNIVPDVHLSDHGAHVRGIPFFDTHPTYRGKLNWKVVEGGYIRGIP